MSDLLAGQIPTIDELAEGLAGDMAVLDPFTGRYAQIPTSPQVIYLASEIAAAGSAYAGLAAAVEKALATSAAEIVLPPGQTVINFSAGQISLGDTSDSCIIISGSTRGRSTLVLDGLANSWAFARNMDSSGNAVDDDSFRAHPSVIFRDLDIDGRPSSNACLIRTYNRSVHLQDVSSLGMHRLIRHNGYTDQVSIVGGIHQDPAQTDGSSFVLIQDSHGDGLIMQSVHCYGGMGQAKLTKCAGGVISAPVGGHYQFDLCDSIEVIGAHLENTAVTVPTFKIRGSRVNFRGGFWWGGTAGETTPILEIDDDTAFDYRCKSDVLLDGVNFTCRISTYDVQRGTDIKLTNFPGYSRLRFRGTAASVFATTTTTRWTFDRMAPIVKASSASIQAAIDANPAGVLGEAEIRNIDGTWMVCASPPMDNMRFTPPLSTPSIDSIAGTTSFPGNAPGGTTWYYRVALRAPDTYSAKSAEVNVTPTSGQAVRLNITLRGTPVVLRIWRGTAADTYDRYIDLPIHGGAVELYDTNFGIAGRPWVTTDVPSVPTGAASHVGIWIGTHRIAWGGAAPVAGAWVQGDVVFNHAATASNPAGWVCVGAGTPGTWKAMANLAA